MSRDVGRHALLEPILLRRRHRTPYFSDLLVPQLYGARASQFRTAPVVPADQEPATSLHDLSTCPNIAAPFIRHRQAAGIDGRCGGRRTRVRLGPLKRNCLRSTLAVLFADIASAQPSSAGLLASLGRGRCTGDGRGPRRRHAHGQHRQSQARRRGGARSPVRSTSGIRAGAPSPRDSDHDRTKVRERRVSRAATPAGAACVAAGGVPSGTLGDDRRRPGRRHRRMPDAPVQPGGGRWRFAARPRPRCMARPRRGDRGEAP